MSSSRPTVRRGARRTVVALAALAAAGVLSLAPAALAAVIDGTTGPDDLVGTEQGDTINGYGGADTITALGGYDHVLGGPGPDAIDGGNGPDTIDGGPGGDVVHGGVKRDYITSTDPGFDSLYGDGDRDLLYLDSDGVAHGGFGDDHLGTDEDTSSTGDTSLYGDAGADQAQTYSTTPGLRIFGGPGNDDLEVYGTAETVDGGTGNDQIIVWDYTSGIVTGPITGGSGDDSVAAQNGHAETISCGPGTDTVGIDLEDSWSADCEAIEYRTSGTNGDDRIIGTVYNDIEDGYAGDDLLSGRVGDDFLYAGVGDDTLLGGVGDDILYGEEGQDTLSGGEGDDLLFGARDGEADTITCGPGVDEVYAEPVDSVAADCENVHP